MSVGCNFIQLILTGFLLNLASSSPEIIQCNYKHVGVKYLCEITANISNPLDIELQGEHVGQKTDVDVKAVIFNESRTAQIPPLIFQKFKNLAELNLISSGLLEIEKLENCGKLEVLSIVKSQVHSLGPNLFQECPKLREIKISTAGIRSIDASTFDILKNLEILDLSTNQIAAYMELKIGTFGHLQNLKTLNLGANQMSIIPSHLFAKLWNLTVLKLPGNLIESIEEGAFKDLVVLDELDLGFNRLSVLYLENFFGNPKLKGISLIGNQLSEIQEETFEQLPSLANLDLRNNRAINFHFIDPSPKTLKEKLSTCFQNFNKSHIICRYQERLLGPYGCLVENFNFQNDRDPRIIGQHLATCNDDNVTEIEFKNSSLPTIPQVIFQKFKNLHTLSVNSVGLRELEFFPLCDLAWLWARNNYLTILRNDTFKKTKLMQRLDLSGNKINRIFNGTFDDLEYLVELDLRENYCVNEMFFEEGVKGLNQKLEVCYRNAVGEAGNIQWSLLVLLMSFLISFCIGN
jgi:Leucine-rich repeat (LRR) protein